MELDVQKSRVSDTNQCTHESGYHTINLYKYPPFGQLTLEECEDLFRQRLEAYTVIERADHSENTSGVTSNALREIKSHVFKTNCLALKKKDTDQHKQDHFSHMLARMYCIYHPDLWSWFKSCEKKLLNYRLRDQMSSLSGVHIEDILRNLNFRFDRVTGQELSDLQKENLIAWNRSSLDRENVDTFKVKFIDALKFVSKRSVALKDGYAFLSRHEIASVVCDVFEKHLEGELNFGRQHLNSELVQAQHLLENLHMVFLDFRDKIDEELKRKRRNDNVDSRNPFKIDINDIEPFVKDHYPPCMRYLHESLLEDHHLKHNGRLYYGTFLKSGGVDLESSIEFWRREFTKKIPNDKFERDYKYNIRHIYGKEGHKKELTCFSCDKIINDNAPGPQDKHGCPFKHFDDAHLKPLLAKRGLRELDIESIIQHKTNKDYRLACSHYFSYIKGEFPTEPIKNPIHYFYESMRLANRPAPTEDWSDEDVQIPFDAPDENQVKADNNCENLEVKMETGDEQQVEKIETPETVQ